ncbi:heterokaryon incompatibility protein [Grosmannia clavigera kw1407]|uniref:Heterokaryon incompatibility protein n=1 Tax=Grosmannia clavigera (strain kw1407 / UAMH 11150) TaxID=655863 RepID=F0XUK5_GROCL|nr:heterokaryon incompatibility protein [Grosmannia clavigera kw1407]EFW98780.1 heterokaryon incompatibility protein [Grosmannia clavigera kw1407]
MAALQQLRMADRARVLWVDAVCINQQDIPERGEQVKLMAEIYHSASQVVVWLGEAHSNSTLAFKLIQKLAPVAGGEESPQSQQSQNASAIRPVDLTDVENAAWVALDALYWRPWFTRVWVIQEIAVSRSAVIMCGADIETFDSFCAVTNYISQHGLTAMTTAGTLRIQSLMMTRLNFQQKIEILLMNLLVNFRMYQATNAVDKVYALLNLANNTIIQPDYSMEAKDVYSKVAREFLAQSLLVLSFNCDPNWKAQDGIVSWAPDWSCRPREVAFLSRKRLRPWQAGGQGPHVIRFSEDSRTLFAQGRVIDKLRTVGEGYAYSDVNFSHLSQDAYGKILGKLDSTEEVTKYFHQRRWRGWEHLVLKLQSYPATGENIRTVFQKILIANADFDAYEGSRSLPSLETMFDAFRKYEWHRVPQRPATPEGQTEYGYYQTYMYYAVTASSGRTVFSTKRGYAGLAPYSSRPGDYVVVLHGGGTPYILRKSKRSENFIFMGEAYLHGFMDGEGIDDINSVQEFAIV